MNEPLTKREVVEAKKLHKIIMRGKATRKQILRGLDLGFKARRAADAAADQETEPAR